MPITLVAAVTLSLATTSNEPPLRFARWEKEIVGIEKRLTAASPKKGGVVFAGSSSIRLWDVPAAFPGLNVANVGFGGSEIRDCTFFAPRLVLPHEPKAVVFYAGDNDIANGRKPEQVRDDFAAFVKAIHAKRPDCRILFVAVKPSLKRWAMYGTQTKANQMVKELCEKNDRLTYLDVVTPMLGTDGKPPAALFVKDELHLSAEGYRIWAKVAGDALRDGK